MSNRTFPKEGVKKLKETIRDLKAKLRESEKENRLLKEELVNIMKPARERKHHQIVPKIMDRDAWRKEFLKKLKEDWKIRDDER